ncbi:MAG TPA: hypothetical protein DEG96_08995 [Candidatus Atribacteria bacterium]|nr:hypothetical protein [Candidatus Atribacteria bacterium]
MSIILFIFLLYILIILFGWLQYRIKLSNISDQQKEESIDKEIIIQDETKLPEYSSSFKNVDHKEIKDEIIVDDEVKEFYKEEEKKPLDDKPQLIDQKKIIFDQESELKEYLSNDILVNGIILSEIIAPPRALNPYKFKKYKRWREISH